MKLQLIWNLLLLCAVGSSAANVEMQSMAGDLPQRRDGVAMHGVAMETVLLDSLYTVGPGDFFNVYIENAMLTLQVSPEGSVGVEQVGIIPVAGLSLAAAKVRIQQALDKYYRSVYVQLAQMKTYKIPVLGYVVVPSQHQFMGLNRLSFVLRQAGGYAPGANNHDILLIRGQDTLHFDIALALQKGNLAADPFVYQGDVVYVPNRVAAPQQVSVFRDGATSSYIFTDSITVGNFLQENRLLEGDAGIYWLIVRNADGTSHTGSYAQLANQKLQPGSTVELARSEEFVYVGGSTAMLGKVPYRPGYSPMSYIAAAGVTIFSGSFDQLKVIRRDGTHVDLNPQSGVIEAGDYIELPRSTYERVKDVTLFLASLLGVFSSFLIIYTNMD